MPSRYLVAAQPGWRPDAARDFWSLPLARRAAPLHPVSAVSGEQRAARAGVSLYGLHRLWAVMDGPRLLASGASLSLRVAKRHAEIAARRYGLRPARYVELLPEGME